MGAGWILLNNPLCGLYAYFFALILDAIQERL